MGKIIRSTYPAGFSIGVLLLIFIIATFLSHQIFEVPIHDLDQNINVYYGMFLVGVAVIIMTLIMWEEILFPIKLKAVDGGLVFRNHRTKLKAQVLIYFSIPAIFTFIYFEYEVNHIRFFLWAAACMIPPVIEKIFSGLNNYNDYLQLTSEKIEYKNNEKVGSFKLKDLQSIAVINDERNIIQKIQLIHKNDAEVIIDLDEMELEAFYSSISKYITTNYKHLLK
jgi:hypothetical protein